jgi:hypothetical protein
MMFISTVASMATGLVMSIIRINEPYFKFLLVQWYKGIFGIMMSEKDKNIS